MACDFGFAALTKAGPVAKAWREHSGQRMTTSEAKAASGSPRSWWSGRFDGWADGSLDGELAGLLERIGIIVAEEAGWTKSLPFSYVVACLES